jgi:hypothetical protein
LGEDIGVEHSLHRNAVGGGFEACDAPDAVDQRYAVVGAGAPDQRAIDIEQD